MVWHKVGVLPVLTYGGMGMVAEPVVRECGVTAVELHSVRKVPQ